MAGLLVLMVAAANGMTVPAVCWFMWSIYAATWVYGVYLKGKRKGA